MAFRFLLAFLLLLVPVFGFSQYKVLLNKSFTERYISLDTLFYTKKILTVDSVTMFREADKLEALAKTNHDPELVFEARLIRSVYDMVGLQQNHKRAEIGLLALRDEADEKKNLQLQIRTREKLAYYYFYIAHRYGPAFENFLAYYKLLKDVPASQFPGKQELIANIGSAYFNFGDNQNARQYFAEAQKVAPSYKKRFLINLQNTLGLIYRSEKKYKIAEQFFRKAYVMAQDSRDSVWIGIAAGNIGISYFYQKKYDEALPLLKLDVRQSMLARERDNALSSLVVIAKINVVRSNWGALAENLSLARKLLPITGNPTMHLRELYPLMAKSSAAAGNFPLAYRYADSAAIVRDSIYNRRNAVLLTRIEQKAEIEKHHAQVQSLKDQKKFQTLLVYSLVAVLILLLMIGALVINRQRLLHKQKQHQLRHEKETIQSDLQEATTQLQEFTERIKNKNRLIDEIEQDLKKALQQSNISKAAADTKVLLQLQQATLLTDKQWEEFRELFEKVHQGFLQRLKEKVSGLSPAETRFIVLSKLGLTNKDMAGMLGVSAEAIRLTRHRLRKKLETSGISTLEEILRNV
jgi:DNA-binding CsgD family transcriptional regulator